MAFTVERSRILSKECLPCGDRWFADGRIAFQANNDEIGDINYFGPTKGHSIAMRSRFWGGLRYSTVTPDGHRRRIRPEKTTLLPFGFFSEGDAEGNSDLSVFAAENAIFLRFTLKRPSRVEVHFYDEYLFRPETVNEDVRYGGSAREYTAPRMENGRLCYSYVEKGDKTNVAISATRPLRQEGQIRTYKVFVGKYNPFDVCRFGGCRTEKY